METTFTPTLVIVVGPHQSGKSEFIQECRTHLWSVDNQTLRTTHISVTDLIDDAAEVLGYSKSENQDSYYKFIDALHELHTNLSDAHIAHVRMSLTLARLYQPPKRSIVFYETSYVSEALKLKRQYPESLLVYMCSSELCSYHKIMKEMNPDYIKKYTPTKQAFHRQALHLGMQLSWRSKNAEFDQYIRSGMDPSHRIKSRLLR